MSKEEEREKTAQRNKGLHLGLNLSFQGFLDCPAAFKQNRYECSCLFQRQALHMFVCVSTRLLVHPSADLSRNQLLRVTSAHLLPCLSSPFYLACDYWVGRSCARLPEIAWL